MYETFRSAKTVLRPALNSIGLHAPANKVYHDTRYAMITWPHRISSCVSRRQGVTTRKRDAELIVSLTSIPERIATLHICLDSLLRQSLKPDRLVLWLSETRQQGRPLLVKDRLPARLAALQRRGLEIRWCRDIGSYCKIIPALREFPDALVVTADDDIVYPRSWLRLLYEAYQREPQYVHCHRAHLVRYDDKGRPLPYCQWDFCSPEFQGPSLDLFPTGCGGVLYAPGHLACEVLNEAAFLELCPKADDVWLKAMSALNNVPCKKVAPQGTTIHPIRIEKNRELSTENVVNGGNDPQIQAVMLRYDVFRRRVNSDCIPGQRPAGGHCSAAPAATAWTASPNALSEPGCTSRRRTASGRTSTTACS